MLYVDIFARPLPPPSPLLADISLTNISYLFPWSVSWYLNESPYTIKIPHPVLHHDMCVECRVVRAVCPPSSSHHAVPLHLHKLYYRMRATEDRRALTQIPDVAKSRTRVTHSYIYTTLLSSPSISGHIIPLVVNCGDGRDARETWHRHSSLLCVAIS